MIDATETFDGTWPYAPHFLATFYYSGEGRAANCFIRTLKGGFH